MGLVQGTLEEYVFDIEADGLLRPNEPQISRIWCIVVRPVGKEPMLFADQDVPEWSRQGTVVQGAHFIREHEADTWVGHNSLDYDFPAISRCFPHVLRWRNDRDPLWQNGVDTLIWSRLMYPPELLSVFDKRRPGFPGRLSGHHSLEAWGHRFHFYKYDQPSFDKLTKDMVDYCVRDTFITEKLYLYLKGKSWSPQSLELEKQFAHEIGLMMMNGVGFDLQAAAFLNKQLSEREEELNDILQLEFGPRVIEWETPKKKLKRRKEEPWNLNSHQQLAQVLQEKYGWEPKEFTNTGLPKMDEGVISSMDPKTIPVRDFLLERAILSARLGTLTRGKSAYLKMAVATPDGWARIYGNVNHNGTRTGRCSHSRPNLGNPPRVGTPWGNELRACFAPPQGFKLVGADMKSVEARMLAHYLRPFDKGQMAERVLTADIHEQNRLLIAKVLVAEGLPEPDRQQAKNAFYAVVYGAWGPKVATMTWGVKCNCKPWKNGKECEVCHPGVVARAALLAQTPGLSALITSIQEEVKEQGWIPGLDGRKMVPNSPFSAGNTLIQGAGAVAFKRATINARAFLPCCAASKMVLHVHDEYQWEVLKGADDDEVGGALVAGIQRAGEDLKLTVPLDGDWKSGANWSQTH